MPFLRLALISTSNKTGVEVFARRLVKLGFEILSTGGTAAFLEEHGVPVTYVSDHTGSPEILGGRVKTLHPKVHGGLLARPDDEEDAATIMREGIRPIEVAAVNLYPFQETLARGAPHIEILENIDIGGPAILRASAKNYENVAVVVDPADYETVADGLESGGLTSRLRHRLAGKAFAHTAEYDAAVATYFACHEDQGAKSNSFPEILAGVCTKAQDLRYGENPHQRGAFYVEGGSRAEPVIGEAVQIRGKELSFNNILDADAALETVKELEDTAAIIIKHTNPCGAATAPLLADAYRKARACDEISAFGGVVALNREVDEETALALAETFLEIVISPAFSDEALKVLAPKKNLRLLAVSALDAPRSDWDDSGLDMKRVGGGILVQERDRALFGEHEPKVVSRRAPTEREWEAMCFGWRLVKHVKSNAIVYTTTDQLVGVGAGQMSRVDSCKIAVERAALPLQGVAVASDAFFPFRDGLDIAARAGATAAIQPGGSKRDDEVIAAADEHDMAMVLTGVRHFRH